MAKYLAPEGILVFIWNIESNKTEWQARVRELYQPYDKGTPQYWKGLWREGYKTSAFKKNFQEPEEKDVIWYKTVEDQTVCLTVSSVVRHDS